MMFDDARDGGQSIEWLLIIYLSDSYLAVSDAYLGNHLIKHHFNFHIFSLKILLTICKIIL